jgi:allantoinase
MYDLTLTHGIIVTPQGRYRADLGVLNGKTACIATDLSGAPSHEAINLEGQFILPGCIDSHMHLWEPGLVAGPDFRDGTRAAAAGGITTIVDHALTIPEVLTANIFESKRALGEATSYVDFALHGGVGLDNLADLPGLWQAGCTAFKIFMCDSGSKVAGINDGLMLEVFRTVGKLGGTVLLHAENDAMLQYNRQRLIRENRCGPSAFTDWRPPEAETEAIHRALFLLQGTGAKAVFLHTTVPEGVDLITLARQQDRDVWVETCPHNLYLTTEHLAKQGSWVTFAPPVRDPGRVARLWQQLQQGKIHTLGSDHGTVDPKLKEAGVNDIWKGQFGVPDVETMVPLMLNGVAEGRISLERLAAILSENPSRLYGLYPRKGVIRVGSDADYTIVDLKSTYTLKAENMVTACGWIPYEGWTITGKVTHAILRGIPIMSAGKILGAPGDGQFIKRNS